MDACLYHFLSILSLGTLFTGEPGLLADAAGDLVLGVEADALVEGHRVLTLVLQVHGGSLVLDLVVSHLIKTSVFLSFACFFVDLLLQASQRFLKFFPANFTIVIGIEFFHEH